jgi:hypothetical protein
LLRSPVNERGKRVFTLVKPLDHERYSILPSGRNYD